jgi:hypothetical protein
MTERQGEFVDAFDWAVVRLATYVPESATRARLLFGTVSLLTKDRPRPASQEEVERHRPGAGKRGTVFFKSTVLTARDAVAWPRRREHARRP